jgi:hypothetical protein
MSELRDTLKPAINLFIWPRRLSPETVALLDEFNADHDVAVDTTLTR